ncbi:hypothetical protein NIES4106_61160 (plasmid) [Fischerella sp. NIES-4106]|nr:hypothetical protein NIES4106_61160 [Fischerella sp. NIES-4106]
MNWKAFKKGECPICGELGKQYSNSCKIEEVTKVFLCRTSAVDPSVISEGYKLLGLTRCGTWAKLVEAKEDDRQWTEENRKQWAEEQKRRLEKEELDRQQKLDKLLSIEDRDKEYRKVLSKLSLTSKHRKHLLEKRGLTKEEIDFAYDHQFIRSLNPGQRFFDVNPNLAGVAQFGFGKDVLLLGVQGFTIAAVDGNGHILGHQIACDDREKYKYLWLSSTRRSGNGPHLPNGEMPLFVWRHPQATQINETWIVEGGLKSLIIALKLWFRQGRKNIQVIGGYGALWTRSPQMLKESLSAQTTKRVILWPDAGSTSNHPIFGKYEELLDFVSGLGYSAEVAWWGQTVKGVSKDADELENFDGVKFISPGEFIKMKSPDDESPNRDWTKWLESRKFTPDIEVNLDNFFFPSGLPKNNAIIAVKSGLGTNKTGAMIQQIKRSPNRAIIFGSRNNLLLQTISRAAEEKVTIYHVHEDEGRIMIPDVNTNIAACIDSSPHFDGYFKGVDLYFDEIVSVLIHALSGGTLKENQAKVLAILTKAIQECDNIYLLDGNLSDLVVDFISSLCPEKKVVKIGNKKKSRKHRFTFVECVVEEEIKKRDRSPMIQKMLKPGVIPWIASDSKELTSVLDYIFKKHSKRGYVLNKETSNEPWAKEFLENPNKFIEQYKPEYFIHSPSAESGISVTLCGHFTHKFTLFNGVLGTSSQYQLMMRLRDNLIEHFVFCPEKSFIQNRQTPRTYSAKKFEQLCHERIVQSSLLAIDISEEPQAAAEIIAKAVQRNNDPWWKLSCKFGALDNFEMNNLRKCLIHVLEEAGHEVEVEDWEASPEHKEIEKQCREDYQKLVALKLKESEPYENLKKAEEMLKKNGGDYRAMKTFLLEKLPGIDKSDVWSHDFVYQYIVKNKNLVSTLQKYYFLTHYEISKKRNEVDWFYESTKEFFFMQKPSRSPHLKIWALKELNIEQFTTGEWHKDSPEIIELCNRVRNDAKIANALGVTPKPATVEGSERIKFVSSLLEGCGIHFKKLKKKNIGGVRIRVYGIDSKKMNDAGRLAILEAIDRKYSTYLESEVITKIQWKLEEIEPPQEVITPPSFDENAAMQTLDAAINKINQEEMTLTQVEEQQLMQPENLQAIADDLMLVDDAETLSLIRESYPSSVLKAATKLLTKPKQLQIRDWVINLNSQQQNAA